MLPHGSPARGGGWEGPGGASCPAEGLLGTFLRLQSILLLLLLLPAAFPNLLTAARSPSSPTFSSSPPLNSTSSWSHVISSPPGKAFLAPRDGLLRRKRAQRASREGSNTGKQARRPGPRGMLSEVHVDAPQPHLTPPGARAPGTSGPGPSLPSPAPARVEPCSLPGEGWGPSGPPGSPPPLLTCACTRRAPSSPWPARCRGPGSPG